MNAYRTAMYQQYVNTQFPAWAEPSLHADAVWRKAALHRMRSWLPASRDARCLDLGCGPGQLMLALQEAGYPDVTGVDLGHEAVSIARELGLNATLGDAREFLGRDESYDLITAFDFVEHFRKDELLDLLRLIHRRLRPNGVFIFQTPNAVSPWASDYRYADFTHELLLSPRSAAAILTVGGFGDIEVRAVTPYVHGPVSAARAGIWGALWTGCALWNLAETGTLSGGVYSRNMLVKGAPQL